VTSKDYVPIRPEITGCPATDPGVDGCEAVWVLGVGSRAQACGSWARATWWQAGASALDEAVLDGEVDQFGVGVKAQRLHRLILVELHRAGRDLEQRGDLLR
jgi:hypothetical protein